MNNDLLKSEFTHLLEGVPALLPEIAITLAILILVIQDLLKRSKVISGLILIAGILVSVSYLQVSELQAPWDVVLTHDPLSLVSRWLIALTGLVTVLISNQRTQRPGEYFTLIGTIILGAYLAVSFNHLLILVVSLEMISIPSYLLAGFSFRKRSSEASMKYFLFGAASTAVLIYGISWLYGLTGHLTLDAVDIITGRSIAVNVASILIIAGFFFKIAAVPMHIWLPDVYQEAPTPVVAFFSVVPKVAGLVALTRFAFWYHQFIDPNLIIYVIAVVSMVTMVMGNFSALRQNNAKRMMGYSSIAHSGFLMIGIAAFSETGLQSMIFYLIIYFLMNYGAFVLIHFLEKEYNMEEIDGYNGLGKALPMLGVLFIVVMISLTGLPPTAGFTAKFLLFSALWESYAINGMDVLLILFVFGLINTVIALFYYLRIPFSFFFRSGEFEILNLNIKMDVYIGTVLAILLLALFFMPGLLLEAFNNRNFAL